MAMLLTKRARSWGERRELFSGVQARGWAILTIQLGDKLANWDRGIKNKNKDRALQIDLKVGLRLPAADEWVEMYER